jgi:hypothetical protein
MVELTIKARVERSAIKFVTSRLGFSVMQILLECNLRHQPGPIITIQQALHALDEMTREGQLVKRAAGRFAWRQ